MSNMYEAGDYQTAQTLETFGFLPSLTKEEVYAQIAYIIAQGWTPAIEHEDPNNATSHYWTMWKLPFFGEQDVARVIEQLDACHRSYPNHHVRLMGYDNYTQYPGACFVVYEGRV